MNGHRVTKTAGGVTTVFVYNVGGQLIAEYGGTSANGGASYLTTDPLGSTRVVTDSNKAVIARHDYLPFGEEIPSGIGNRTPGLGYVTTDDTTQRFTSKERDAETGLDYFGARYYSSPQGRFNTTDPNPVTKENFVNPQRWNLFVYVNNNPLAAADPSGGDGEGKGGDKVISVFLVFQASQRDTTASGAREGGPGWAGLKDSAAKNGYQLNIYGSRDLGGSAPATGPSFESALESSEVVVYIGHSFQGSFGEVGGVPVGQTREYVPTYILVGDTAYGNGGSGVPAGAGYIPTGAVPESSASVLGTFACNSSKNPHDYVTPTASQFQVAVDSGKDGLTSMGTLEKAGAAFAKAYVATKGSTKDKVNAGLKAANKVIKEDKKVEFRGKRINEGDRVVSAQKGP
jgi:RHS repeat-associated protein